MPRCLLPDLRDGHAAVRPAALRLAGAMLLGVLMPACAHAAPMATTAYDIASVPSDGTGASVVPAETATPAGTLSKDDTRGAPPQTGVALGGMVLPAALVDPVIFFQPRRRGPVLELGALGGGNPRAGGLAHVGMEWKF